MKPIDAIYRKSYEDLLYQLDLVSIVESLGVKLTKKSSVHVGFCPFHVNELTPSFAVYPSGKWICFSTNCEIPFGKKYNSGDAIDFVMKKLGVSHVKAIAWLNQNFLDSKSLSLPTHIEVPKKEVTFLPDWAYYWNSILLGNLDRLCWLTEKRKLTTETITKELLGWDGERYVIPIWENYPGNSLVGLKFRYPDGYGKKYIIDKASHKTLWGKGYCLNSNYVIFFAGEFDAILGRQFGLPCVSLVHGALSFSSFPDNWINTWLPNTKYAFIFFDKKEENAAARLASIWNLTRGQFTAVVCHWPLNFKGKDFTNWVADGNSVEEFLKILKIQTKLNVFT